MDVEKFRESQAPLRGRYAKDAKAAFLTLRSQGTLGVADDVPVGCGEIRLRFDIESDAPKKRRDELAERYCLIFNTLQNSPRTDARMNLR